MDPHDVIDFVAESERRGGGDISGENTMEVSAAASEAPAA